MKNGETYKSIEFLHRICKIPKPSERWIPILGLKTAFNCNHILQK